MLETIKGIKIIDTTVNNLSAKGISFNYSENFNHITELNIENFQNWKTNILYLLTINNLDEYISSQKIKKLRRKDIRENLDDYIIDKFDSSLVYDAGTTQKDIKNDILVKWIITNSLGNKTKEILKGHSKTAFQMWNFLQESFTLGDEHRKMILKNRINFLKFNINDDIHIFLATLQNMLDELEIIDSDISDNTKVGILNRALPENLRWINVFQFNNNWKECCNFLKKIVPDITFSHLKEKKIQEEKSESIFHLHSYPKSKIRDKKRKYSKRKNGKCFLCGKYGHYIKDCFKNKKISFNKVTKNNKSNKDKRESDKKYNKNKINNKHVYLINNNKEYKDNYQEDFSKDYFSDNALEINSIETNNNYNKINEIKNNNFIVWILDSGASISTTNNSYVKSLEETDYKYKIHKIF